MDKYKSDSESKKIGSLITETDYYSKKGRFILNPKYQRDVVWDTSKMMCFLDSVYRGIIPNNIIFNKKKRLYTCIDGKQRLTTLCKFMKNQIPINIDGKIYYYEEDPNYKDRNYLSEEQQARIEDRSITLVTYNNLTYQDQMIIFNRLQHGVALSSGELIPAKFITEKLIDVFINYGDKLKKIFGHIYSFNVNIKRKQHYKIMIDILYNLDLLKNDTYKNSLSLLSKQDRNHYIRTKLIDDVELDNKLKFTHDQLMSYIEALNKSTVSKIVIFQFVMMFIGYIYYHENKKPKKKNIVNIVVNKVKKRDHSDQQFIEILNKISIPIAKYRNDTKGNCNILFNMIVNLC